MNTKNIYIIEVEFDFLETSKKIYKGNIPYKGSNYYKDKLEIWTNKIIIEAKRSSIIPLEDIINNHFSSLYNQLIKSFLYYYTSNRKGCNINSISIKRKRIKKILDSKNLNKDNLKQLLNLDFRLENKVNQENAKVLFEETDNGRSVLIAISYLLASNNKLSENQRFEKLWKAFNRLYKQIGKKSTEIECLIELKKIISKNPLIAKNSSQKVKNLNVKKLRDSIRWRAMILNDYDTESKTKAFSGFIMRHKDPRIMQIILDTDYGYRKDFFISQHIFPEVKTHVDTCIKNNEISDVEIVTFLTGKYMYFVRNKMFHGETIDNSFRLSTNKEDIELKFLNDILEAYITDLINI